LTDSTQYQDRSQSEVCFNEISAV